MRMVFVPVLSPNLFDNASDLELLIICGILFFIGLILLCHMLDNLK